MEGIQQREEQGGETEDTGEEMITKGNSEVKRKTKTRGKIRGNCHKLRKTQMNTNI